MIGSGYERRSEGMGPPETPLGPRVRAYELAKDLGVQPKDLVAKVRAMGIDIANHMSQIEPGEAAYPYHYHLAEEELLVVK